jgi:hypothetical protein
MANEKNPAPKSAAVAAPSANPPESWVKLSISRRFYKPEFCSEYSIQGYILASEVMGADSPNGPFTGYIIRLTAPSKCVDEGDNLQDAKIGDDLILVATHSIKKLEVFANDPEKIGEFWIKPIKKIQHSGGKKSLWEYDVRVNPKPANRADLEAAAFKEMTTGGNAAAPALAQ